MPEIADGIVEIKACAREPGHRTKIAVWSNDPNVDPVGACVGARGARVRMVVNELHGEKIDIVPFSDDPSDFVMKALSPAKVKEVRIDEETGTAKVIVPDYQLSLAIGKEGQNARLAARLTGWRVDIKSETQLAEEEAYQGEEWAEGEWVVDPETGEQVWQPAEGGPALSAEEWAHAGDDERRAEAAGERRAGAAEAEPEAGADRGRAADVSHASRRRAPAAPRAAEWPQRPAADLRRVPAPGRPGRAGAGRARPRRIAARRPYTARSRSLAVRRVPPLRAASRPAQRPQPGAASARVTRSGPGPGPGRPRLTAGTATRSESCRPSGSCEDGRPWCGQLAAARPRRQTPKD